MSIYWYLGKAAKYATTYRIDSAVIAVRDFLTHLLNAHFPLSRRFERYDFRLRIVHYETNKGTSYVVVVERPRSANSLSPTHSLEYALNEFIPKNTRVYVVRQPLIREPPIVVETIVQTRQKSVELNKRVVSKAKPTPTPDTRLLRNALPTTFHCPGCTVGTLQDAVLLVCCQTDVCEACSRTRQQCPACRRALTSVQKIPNKVFRRIVVVHQRDVK